MKKHSMLIMAGLLLLAACGKKNTNDIVEEIKIVPVNVLPVERQTIRETATFFGDILADQSVKVYSTVPNRITKLHHDIGDEVTKGDLLLEIDTEKIRQAVDQAEAGLESARAQLQNISGEYDRLKKLYNEKAISQSQMDGMTAQLDGARSSVKQLEAAYSSAKSQLQETRIKAPVTGILVSRTLNEGDLASPQIPLFEIANMDTVRVIINVIERQLPDIKLGQPAFLKVTAHPETIFTGVVTRVNPSLNPLTRTADAEIRIPNDNHHLRPGMFSKVEVVLNEHNNSIVIGKASILEKTKLAYDNGQLSTARVVVDRYVYIANNSRAQFRQVQTGIIADNLVEIIDGVKDGELIVTIGQHNLEPNDSLKIVNQVEN